MQKPMYTLFPLAFFKTEMPRYVKKKKKPCHGNQDGSKWKRGLITNRSESSPAGLGVKVIF